jgi:low affinity Fe/Cu permease
MPDAPRGRLIGATVTASDAAITTANTTVDPTQPTTIEKPPGLFLEFANWVSEAMGKPANIAFWFVLIVVWTLVFALGGPHLASGTWLPGWFTSTGYNFPLNLITTVAELFIGFLVAAAANRSQNALTVLLAHIRAGVERDVTMERELTEAIAENTELTKQVHDLQVTMSKQMALLEDTRRLVAALSPNASPVQPPQGSAEPGPQPSASS